MTPRLFLALGGEIIFLILAIVILMPFSPAVSILVVLVVWFMVVFFIPVIGFFSYYEDREFEAHISPSEVRYVGHNLFRKQKEISFHWSSVKE